MDEVTVGIDIRTTSVKAAAAEGRYRRFREGTDR